LARRHAPQDDARPDGREVVAAAAAPPLENAAEVEMGPDMQRFTGPSTTAWYVYVTEIVVALVTVPELGLGE